ncbi:DUF222 domain-containing protein [Microbispora hainanensis]|uniref:DUF222 domain-containing protein n=1 Tax=Microbispora hainanensis TaxID=568844 RepID=UPI00142F0C45|nr:HNH endonuclease signature motif containing protein [Microbispora hainanensis]
MTANSPLWSSDGSSAREPFPINDFEPPQGASRAEGEGDTGADGDADSSTSDDAPGAGQGKGRSSWVVVGCVREVAQELALVPLPDDVDVCLAEAEELLFARDRITCALADRVGRVHRAGQAKQHGHASTRCWLRTAGGMTVGGAGRLLMLGAELPRLPVVREKFAVGELAAGVVEAICAAVAGLSDEQAGLAEPILVELAGKAGAAEVAKAGRHLRAVLDPDGEERDERADYGRRFLRVRPGKGGGVEGEFYIPREPGARLMTLLQEYAKKKADGDDRTLTERQADALIAALLEQQIVTELLVVVSAESLPTDPDNTDPTDTDLATEDPADDTADPAPDVAGADASAGSADGTGAPAPGEADDSVFGAMSGPGHAGGADDPDGFDAAEADEFDTPEAEAGAGAGSDAAADGATDAGAGSADNACATTETGLDVREAEADPASATDSDSDSDSVTAATTDPAAGSVDTVTGLPDEESHSCGVGEPGTGERRPGECEPRDTLNTASDGGDRTANAASAEDDETASTSSAESGESAPAVGGDRAAAQSGAPHATRAASAWPADRGGGSHTAPSDTAPSDTAPSDTAPSDTAPSGATASDAPPSQAAPSKAAQPDPPPEDASAHHTHAGPRPAGDCRHGQGVPGALGVSLGMVPGLLLATGQVLPVSSVHRLARTSTLVRIVMNADGQVLDMGRKVRLATPAQRRAIFARYATCWIDGCPLPATMCQIDHADNWSSGGLTDLKLLGPACQFHNRDRYQHPERYTRRKEGTDRWAFTYHRIGSRRRC